MTELEQLENTRLGRFHLEKRLGTGGFSVVYKAVDQTVKIDAVLKILKPGIANDQQLVDDVFREALTANMVGHEGTAKIWAYDRLSHPTMHGDGVLHCLVMQYCRGETLRKKQFWPDATRRNGLLYQVAQAMAAVHAKGIVHRDLKPENIIVRDDESAVGGVKATVIDFGIARLTTAMPGTQQHQSNRLMGTPAYMAPEIWKADLEGRSPDWHSAVDVYAFGIVMYECVTGKHPLGMAVTSWDAASIESARNAHMRFEPSEQDLARAPELRALTLRCLSKDPSQRPTMADVAKQLRELISPKRAAFESAFLRWKTYGAPLLRGGELDDAKDTFQSAAPPDAERTRFIQASATAEIKRQRRRVVVLAIALATVLMTVITTIVVVSRMRSVQIAKQQVDEENNALRIFVGVVLEAKAAAEEHQRRERGRADLEALAKTNCESAFKKCSETLDEMNDQIAKRDRDIRDCKRTQYSCRSSLEECRTTLGMSELRAVLMGQRLQVCLSERDVTKTALSTRSSELASARTAADEQKRELDLVRQHLNSCDRSRNDLNASYTATSSALTTCTNKLATAQQTANACKCAIPAGDAGIPD